MVELITLSHDPTRLSMPSRFPHVLHATDCYTEDSGKRGAAVTDLPKGSEEQQDYLSYLLRLWKTGGGERPLWRASLKSAHTGEQVGFASLEDLFAFLENETGSPSLGAGSAAKAGSQSPEMPGRQGAPICQAPRERTDKGEEVM
jgi:hypothetical protein